MKVLKTLLLSALLLSASVQAEEKKAVFDLTTGDAERIEMRIIQSIKGLSEHYAGQQVDFEAVVVISGKAYK